MELKGKLVVVTGASSGVGAATARAMAAEGARVVLMARSEDKLKEVADDVRTAGAEAHVYPADLGDPAQATRACEAVVADIGTPDVLINNAGAGRFLFAWETPPDKVVSMMAAPYFAAFFATRVFVPGMLERGSGHVVNITSPAGFLAWPGAIGYSAARWAVRGFNDCLASDLHGSSVKVTLVTPGEITSDYFVHNPGAEERIPTIAKLFPRLSPEQTARLIIKGVQRERRHMVKPFLLRLTLLSHRLMPGITNLLVRATGAHR